jgi:hypothetical protein
MVLRDASGFVVDSLNYGGLVDPWAAEGYQAVSGAGQSGCRAPVPSTGSGQGRGAGGGAGGGGGVNRSAGRFPDGADADSNCTDFLTQSATTLPAASAAGATNVKVNSVTDFAAGQTITIDAGADAETAVIAMVGTSGATTIGADASAGATVISVAGVVGFSAGQTITIDSGANAETTTVVSSAGAGRGPSTGSGQAGGGRGGAPTAATITLAAPLSRAHATGAQVSGTGITLTLALTRAHSSGTQVASAAPTPGAANKYIRR